MRRTAFLTGLMVFITVSTALAEVTGVSIRSRTIVAGGQSFGATGAYEEDLAGVRERAAAHWEYATRSSAEMRR